MKPPKFAGTDSSKPFEYGNQYDLEEGEGWARVVIGPNRDHIKVLDTLSDRWSTPDYFVLYVSLMSHTGKKTGRYQSPMFNKEDLDLFLYTHREFLEGYGGQHLWVGHPNSGELLVYDHHNLIYAYGNIDSYVQTLEELGFRPGRISIPAPHTHSFDSHYTQLEDDLFGYFDWTWFPLQDGDDE